jgi:hypothetical protein
MPAAAERRRGRREEGERGEPAASVLARCLDHLVRREGCGSAQRRPTMQDAASPRRGRMPARAAGRRKRASAAQPARKKTVPFGGEGGVFFGRSSRSRVAEKSGMRTSREARPSAATASEPARRRRGVARPVAARRAVARPVAAWKTLRRSSRSRPAAGGAPPPPGAAVVIAPPRDERGARGGGASGAACRTFAPAAGTSAA